jgi:hypothetical protein
MRKSLKFYTLAAALVAMGCGSSDQTFNFSNFPNGNPVTPPTAVADSFKVLGNGQLTASVTANDTVNGATVTQFQNPGNAGGTVQIAANGQLTYTPPANQANLVDTFTYTLTNTGGSSTATVTVTIGARGFFVKNDAPAGGSGSQTSPFNTLLAGVTAAAGVNGAQVVVFRGDGTATGQNVPVALSANQAIIAQDPVSPPVISGPITLASNCTLSNLRLVGTTGGDAVIGTAIAGATLSNLTVANTTANGVNMTNPTGTLTMTGLSMSNIGRAVFPLSTTAGTLNVVASNWTVTNTVGNVSEASIGGTSVVNASFDQVNFSNIGNVFPFEAGFQWDARNTSNATLALSNYRFDNGGNGLVWFSRDTSSTAVLLSNVNITNGSDRAILLTALNSSSLKTRSTNSRYVGNLQGFRTETSSAGLANLCARLTGNTSDSYQFLQALASICQVENLAGVSTENVGTTSTVGTIQDVAVGSCGIP